jgi:hypothetical protein
MSKSLFLGDSHSAGYWKDKNNTAYQWTDNNYASIYSKINNKDVVVYAIPGGCNLKYPTWVRAMLNLYNDIDEIFVQSTYWDRYLLACSRNLDYGDGISPEHFTDFTIIEDTSPRVKYFTDNTIVDNYVESVEKCWPELFENFKGISVDPSTASPEWAPFHEKYPYTKLYHEHLTHLQYRQYCGDLYLINAMCKEYGVRWHLWNINDRVYMPKNLEFYGSLSHCTVAPESAQSWIKKTFNGLDIEKNTIDGEHYPMPTHEIIAKDYLSYLKELDKT